MELFGRPSGTGPKPENDCVVVAPVWNNHGRIPFWEWENRGEDRSDKAARPVKRRAQIRVGTKVRKKLGACLFLQVLLVLL